ncbi:MAG: hypothetical protein R3250_15805, partial [Melioribacteraceae bacterium]|nr:hypothetical protein [Melioribacteraceae bacterium]
ESLSYIAQRLGVESSELMEDISQTEKRNVLEKVEKLYKVEFSELTDEHKQIIELIHPIVDKLTLSYESARLLEIYSRCRYHLNHDDWESHYFKALQLYEQLHLYNQSASLALFKGMILYNQHRYEEALAVILEERARFDSPNIKLDAMTTLDYMYAELILYTSVGNHELTQINMKKAMEFSKDERIFYRIDDIYRLACFQSIINENDDERIYYLTKVKQYGEFAENKSSTAIATLLETHYYNSYSHEYQKALDNVELFLELASEAQNEKMSNDDNNHYLLEKGKALFGLGFITEALALFEVYQVPFYLHHPYDLSMSYEVHSYRALCYSHLGELDKALHEAQTGAELISPLPDTPYKQFIFQTLDEIKKQ